MSNKIKKILIANRGEIAIRIIRACQELGIRTVAIYSKEDKYTLFRTKADESYLIGETKGPVGAYLNIKEIISLAKKKGVDAIHPGYGFLSENPEFVRQCEENGIIFIGPKSKMMEMLGDKIRAKVIAKAAGVPIIPGYDEPIEDLDIALAFAQKHGFPMMLKASAGGGGRGMRIVRHEGEFKSAYASAKNEALNAFDNDDMFMEKYIEGPKHIEVQILGDQYGNIVHLFERDCSIQRRHQKVVEFAPALTLTADQRTAICADALKIARAVRYENAGTVEFLVDTSGQHYFIEMNPRIQVEHTVTEMITGIDIVQTQILVGAGYSLDSKEIGIGSQDQIEQRGYAIQCRITTEDPGNNFAPDTGKIDVYRTGSGFGIRLDGGNGYTGATITPYYDSLLVKVTSWSRSFEDAARKASRAIKEITVKGVKINDGFIINVLNHPSFLSGTCRTTFIDDTPELFDIKPRKDKETKILRFIGEKMINEVKDMKKDFDTPIIPKFEKPELLTGTKQILDTLGADGLVAWIKAQNKLLLTDTTFRDAHQSLAATRFRTKDMVKISEATSVLAKDLFSLEMWGGATFDVSYRYLHESPWRRLQILRDKMPNQLFQMLIRGANAVGYTNYPDNVIRAFIRESAVQGIDVFRIFDSLNWLAGMEVALDETLKTGKVAEVAICYTGDILDDRREKYNLQYYVNTAIEIEKMGAHILAIKDMAGLLKPYAAKKLVETLKQFISLPIHLHTHDTSGNGIATIIMAAEGGLDIADAAFNSVSGLTSQPGLNSIVAALENTDRETGIELDEIQKISDYWKDVRQVYEPFESGLKSITTEIYKYEIPGGQYSNLYAQVDSFGIGHLFSEVKAMYKEVNDLLGDIVKVTPSSKMVGDLAIFMVQNGLTKENIVIKGKNLDYPDSVISYFKGMMGQPVGGFPAELQKNVLKGEEAIIVRPGEILKPCDFKAIEETLSDYLHDEPNIRNVLSYALYPKVYKDYLRQIYDYGDLSNLESHIFFYGLKEGETAEIELEEGKIMIIKLVAIEKIDAEGYTTLVFEVNGNRRETKIFDKAWGERNRVEEERMADPDILGDIGAAIPGIVSKIFVKPGEQVQQNQALMVVEAMKMETIIGAPISGIIDKVHIEEGRRVKSGQLLMEIE